MPHSPQNVHKKLLGTAGETLVCQYLKKQRMQILHKNYRTPFGEADVIAKDGDEIAFVEVKTRLTENYGTPREAVGGKKQHRYYKIAEYYWLKTGEEPNARFDVAEVLATGEIHYFKNAF